VVCVVAHVCLLLSFIHWNAFEPGCLNPDVHRKRWFCQVAVRYVHDMHVQEKEKTKSFSPLIRLDG
jgi:hypothetical protein